MKSNILTEENASMYQLLRLQALIEFPKAFGSTYDLEKKFTLLGSVANFKKQMSFL